MCGTLFDLDLLVGLKCQIWCHIFFLTILFLGHLCFSDTSKNEPPIRRLHFNNLTIQSEGQIFQENLPHIFGHSVNKFGVKQFGVVPKKLTWRKQNLAWRKKTWRGVNKFAFNLEAQTLAKSQHLNATYALYLFERREVAV